MKSLLEEITKTHDSAQKIQDTLASVVANNSPEKAAIILQTLQIAMLAEIRDLLVHIAENQPPEKTT